VQIFHCIVLYCIVLLLQIETRSGRLPAYTETNIAGPYDVRFSHNTCVTNRQTDTSYTSSNWRSAKKLCPLTY